jgi:L-ribulose-5-phosphate 3-epimerase
MLSRLTRRGFLQTTVAAAVASAALEATASAAAEAPKPDDAAQAAAKGPRLKKAVKYAMIKAGGTPLEKFELVKRLGFQGVEIDSPSGVDKQAAVEAKKKTGIDIHGVIDSEHWQVRLSDPNPDVRAKALETLKGALRDAKFYGATTALLVPGRVADPKNENFEQVWERSQEQIRKALPLAKELGVKIAIEVVWNDFITKPEQLVKYVDEFNDPMVGAYFDVSNMIKYGVPPADWIRALGKRMLKFDFKGYNGDTKQWVPIGEGTENWPEVLKALDEVGYRGWATSEVNSGDEKWLKEVSERMDRVLGLKS